MAEPGPPKAHGLRRRLKTDYWRTTRIATALGKRQDVLPVRVIRRLTAIGGYDRALALASQAFVALVPAVLILSSMTTGPPNPAVVSSRLGLSPSAAETLVGLFDTPPDSHQSATVIGIALLIVSVFGFIRSLQRTFAAAWDLPPAGRGNFGRGVLAATVLVGELAVLILLAPLAVVVLGSAVIGLAVHAATAILLWWPIQRLLLGARVGWKELLPGALVTGVGQAALVISSSLYMPFAVSRATDQLGILGTAVVLLSWLVFLGLLLVISAVLGAELSRPHASPDRVPV